MTNVHTILLIMSRPGHIQISGVPPEEKLTVTPLKLHKFMELKNKYISKHFHDMTPHVLIHDKTSYNFCFAGFAFCNSLVLWLHSQNCFHDQCSPVCVGVMSTSWLSEQDVM